MAERNNIVIIGGGLAGLTSAIHLCRAGLQVTLIEKHTYPGHKVCGEYISNEVLPYLRWLGADPAILEPAQLSRVVLSVAGGRTITSPLPLGGFGVSRYTLDHFLMQHAAAAGCRILQDTVTDIRFSGNEFAITTARHGMLQAEMTIGAYGKRAALDTRLQRGFLQQRSPWLAVKGHYEGDFPEQLVALHNFSGGYCGVSRIENKKVNICYLVSYDSFRRSKNLQAHREEVLYRNPHLRRIFENCRPLFPQPMTISQIAFGPKQPVDADVLMTGDTAGMIHPLCGNGMAMAIDSARIAAELLTAYFKEHKYNRQQLETAYTAAWNKAFKSRMQMGSLLNGLFLKEKLSAATMRALTVFPALLPAIIRRTHGKAANTYTS
ncbi:NAD(P)/FAD-dependent oxidoreductase [Chitinophaga sp. Mgbs1]|uniref:NAD(P)/FAD-dependent oxidoreductase n=1 Tax=Chitinophaga solisilvae TaxID=1233460 RepID=A0A433WKY3_9BACT|nr:NAD(P)/FAD-dependent oxidoreductase [Chitinophaga solisilvae]